MDLSMNSNSKFQIQVHYNHYLLGTLKDDKIIKLQSVMSKKKKKEKNKDRFMSVL